MWKSAGTKRWAYNWTLARQQENYKDGGRFISDGKYWYLSVGIEQGNNDVELTDEIIGIDIGIKNLEVCSNGIAFKNINKTKKIKKLEKKLHRLQRKVSNKYEENKKGVCYQKTSNIVKLEKQIRFVNRKLNGILKNYLHQAINKIVKNQSSFGKMR